MLLRLLLCALPILSLGFEWEGRLSRLRRDLEDGELEARRDALRELARHPAREIAPFVVAALADPDPGVRLEAARTAGEARVLEALPALLDWLDEPEADARAAAARALGAIGDPSALPSLIRALGDARAPVRAAALEAIAGMDAPAALEPLIGRLDDPDTEVQIAAVRALARRGDPRALVPLIARARDEVPEVRTSVAAALGDLGDRRAVPALIQSLDDSAIDVRLAATMALSRIGDDEAVHVLALRAADADDRIARASVAALGRISGPRALEAVIDALLRAPVAAVARDVIRERAPLERDPIVGALASALDQAELRADADAIAASLDEVSATASIATAAEPLARALEEGRGEPGLLLGALGATGTERAVVPILERLGSEDPALRAAAVRAIERWIARSGPDGRAADPLLEALERAPASERPAIARLLGRIGAPRAVPALRAMLAGEDAEARLAAIEALGASAEPASAPALLALIDDADARVRREAALALGRVAEPAIAHELSARLLSPEPRDRHAILEALGGVLARAPHPIEEAPRQAMLEIASAPDAALASAALHAIAIARDPVFAAPLAALLERAPIARHAPILAAIGALPPSEAAQRTLLAHASDEGSAGIVASAALGEQPGEDTIAALLDPTEAAPWPRSAAASFAIARLARRGAIGIDRVPAICARMRSRDPWIRANLAIALAALGAGACPEGGPDPLRWIEPTHAGVVRAAAARWLAAAAEHGAIDRARASDALARCAAAPLPSAARDACREPALAPLDDLADVIAWSAEGETPLRRALLAVRLADGTAWITISDDAARVLLHEAPRGPIRLDQPASAPLEP